MVYGYVNALDVVSSLATSLFCDMQDIPLVYSQARPGQVCYCYDSRWYHLQLSTLRAGQQEIT